MKNDQDVTDSGDTVKEATESVEEQASGDAEFKVTVRKLEMPVRPRGVLAE